MKDFSDYHIYSWSQIAPPQKKRTIFLHRLPLYLLILIIGGIIFIPNPINQTDRSGQVFYSLFIIIMCLFVILGFHFVLNMIARVRGPRLINFQISKQGITIDSHLHPYSVMDIQAINTNVLSLALHKDLWSEYTPAQNLIITTTKKQINLAFPNEKIKQQALASLKHYLASL